MKVTGKFFAENLDESFTVAKRFILVKIEGGFGEKKIEKVAYKKHRSLKKKLTSRQKVLLLKNLTRPKTVKGGFFQIF